MMQVFLLDLQPTVTFLSRLFYGFRFPPYSLPISKSRNLTQVCFELIKTNPVHHLALSSLGSRHFDDFKKSLVCVHALRLHLVRLAP